MRVAQHVPGCPRPWLQHQGGPRVVPSVRHGQVCGQWEPAAPNRHGQVQRPARPPAMPARLAPAGCRLDRRMRNNPLLAMGVVPHATAGGQRRTVDGDRAPVDRPWLQPRPHVPPTGPHHPGHARRPHGQAAFPRAAGGQAALFAHEGPQLHRDGIVLVEKGQQGLGGIQTTKNHDDQRLHDQALSVRFGAAPKSMGRFKRPGSPVHEHNQTDT